MNQADYEAMKAALNGGGVQFVAAPQLFITPAPLAARMVAMADIEPGHRVLEPSAGTGALIAAIGKAPDKFAVEINPDLVEHLARAGFSGLHVHQGDFLGFNGALGKFDRVIMNPPFSNGQDIAHILHAAGMLKDGGLLVAICAGGPRQNRKLCRVVEERGGTWEALPQGTFKESGTMVNAVLLSIPA